ncbi:serine hydrolase [Runella sp. SP2]|uniref:serine hydrolase domain-containing protein n=1 Tax=Runella sp. SP2 TaxID=2268026 RepID=UPI000F08A1B9|nr:serine hydrolase domain-containing protein [Runella sp. SP2]AYQ33280.1 class A beta-lactamase-related serine hydrolase [Runella sp. SP2]
MKKLSRFCIVFLSLCLLNCSKNTISESTLSTAEDLDLSFKALSQDMLFAGFAVTVVKKDKILFQSAYGQADMAKNVPYTNQTLQPIGSISKTFVGVVLMKAIEQGHFTLETPINDILPFKITNPNVPNSIIRIKHLATHTSGIVDDENVYLNNYSILAGENTSRPIAQRMIKELKVGQNGNVWSLPDFLKAYFTVGGQFYQKTNFLSADAGTTYSYSNIGAALAAYLIEVKTGKSYADYCTENIFKPLGMNQTTFTITPDSRSKMAMLYFERNNPFPFYKMATYPDGGLITSNEDLSKYFVEMMKGLSGESTFLKKESFDVLFKKQFEVGKMPAQFDGKEDNSGIFWFYFKNGRLGHTGGDFGVTTIMAFYPDTKTGFIFLTNTETELIDNADPIKKQLNVITSNIKEFESHN